MTRSLSSEELDAIEARANAASPGPWSVGRGAWHRVTVAAPNKRYPVVDGCLDENAEFIAAAREDVPNLVARVRELEARVEAYEDAALEAREERDV